MVTRKFIWGVLAVALAASAVMAQPFDKRTIFTFSKPIALPGVTLPAGEYLFRLIDVDTSRKAIQVLSADGKKPYVLVNTIPNIRRDETHDATVQFMETAKGHPNAIKTWWYPGETIGYEFIYPKAQARELAKEVAQPVLTVKEETAEVERITPAGEEVAVGEPEPLVPLAIVQEGTLAEARTELPVTGTRVPAFALIGIVALLAAGGLRLWRMARA